MHSYNEVVNYKKKEVMEGYYKYEKTGVTIESRYDKPHEYIIMSEAIKLIPIQFWDLIEKVWCNSKATYTYSLVFLNIRKNIGYILIDCQESFK